MAGVESSLRVTCCRQILQNLPEHNYARPSATPLMGFLHEVRGPASAQADQAWVLTSSTLEPGAWAQRASCWA